MMGKVNVQEKFEMFQDHWHPRIVGDLNDNFIKLAKLKGEFVWHHHENEDEMFLIVKGELLIQFKDRDDVLIKEGEFYIVPKGVEHRPVAIEEVHVMLIEPKSTMHTGNVRDEKTKDTLERI
ncbi:cupin domain-containing protein [Bacillus timonensis]|nr:cupin domain-containing protein [Bacillus timonensis]